MVNARHCETLGHSQKNSLFKWIVVAEGFHIPLFVHCWMLEDQFQSRVHVIGGPGLVFGGTYSVEIDHNISNFVVLVVCEVVVSSLKI